MRKLKRSAKKDDRKKTVKSNEIIVYNILYAKKEKIYPAYVFQS